MPIEKLRDIVTARRLGLVKLGYEPIPIRSGRKMPPMKGWQEVRIALSHDEDTITPWADDFPGALSTGIRTRYTPGGDIDVKDQEVADEIEHAWTGMLSGTIINRIGLPPKRLIPFRCTKPFKKVAATFKAPDDVVHKVEILGDGQQFVAEGIHETTQQPYRWSVEGGLLRVAHENLPLVDEEIARRLMEVARAIMRGAGWEETNAQGKNKTDKPKSKSNGAARHQSDDDADHAGAIAEPGSTIYGRSALRYECDALAAMLPDSGRNNALNNAALKLFSLVAGGELHEEQDQVRERLFAAADKCGLVQDTGAYAVNATIESGAKAGLARPRRAPNGGGEEHDEQNGAAVAPCTLDEMHATFRKWLGPEYDMDAADAVVATAAAEKLNGDPLWLLIVSGPGAAKTETVQALAGCGAHVTSTIQSEGALMSASSKRERSKTATGGLLRKIGDRGILVIKDVTSILSSDRVVRGPVLAAIREIYDGKWERNVGSDGGQTLTWIGRIAVVGAVTTAWDSAHSVIAAMGDRFVLIRIDSSTERKASGRKAIRNTGGELQMRQELAAAIGGVIAQARNDIPTIQEEDPAFDAILNAADIVTLARTAVERDYQGEIVNSHAPEMPTRFAKQLTQMVRGGIAAGMPPRRALELALRCARDSVPPLRLDILVDVAQHPDTRPGDVRRRINKPWRTVRREMDGLHMLGLLTCEEERGAYGTEEKTIWRYRIAPDFDRTTLLAMAGISPSPGK